MAQERVNAARESSLQSSVERRIARWAGDKPLHAMLATLHVLLPKLVAADALAGLTDKPATLVFPATVRPSLGAVLCISLLLLLLLLL